MSQWCFLRVSPKVIDFGAVPVGGRIVESIEIGLSGPDYAADLTLNLAITAPFKIGSSNVIAIGAGEKKTIPVIFQPAAAGDFSGTLTITFVPANVNVSPASPVVLDLTGKCSGKIVNVDTNLVDFGSVGIGVTGERYFTLSAGTGSPVDISVTVGDPGNPFGVVPPDPAVPFLIQPGERDPILVRFTPAAVGEYNAVLSIDHDGANIPSPILIALHGVGVNVYVHHTRQYELLDKSLVKLTLNIVKNGGITGYSADLEAKGVSIADVGSRDLFRFDLDSLLSFPGSQQFTLLDRDGYLSGILFDPSCDPNVGVLLERSTDGGVNWSTEFEGVSRVDEVTYDPDASKRELTFTARIATDILGNYLVQDLFVLGAGARPRSPVDTGFAGFNPTPLPFLPIVIAGTLGLTDFLSIVLKLAIAATLTPKQRYGDIALAMDIDYDYRFKDAAANIYTLEQLRWTVDQFWSWTEDGQISLAEAIKRVVLSFGLNIRLTTARSVSVKRLFKPGVGEEISAMPFTLQNKFNAGLVDTVAVESDAPADRTLNGQNVGTTLSDEVWDAKVNNAKSSGILKIRTAWQSAGSGKASLGAYDGVNTADKIVAYDAPSGADYELPMTAVSQFWQLFRGDRRFARVDQLTVAGLDHGVDPVVEGRQYYPLRMTLDYKNCTTEYDAVPIDLAMTFTPRPPSMSAKAYSAKKAVLALSSLVTAGKLFGTDVRFSAASDTQVNWTSGSFKYAALPAVTIQAGSAAALNGNLTYIYYAPTVDPYHFLVTQDLEVALGEETAVIVCTCRQAGIAGSGAFFVPIVGINDNSNINWVDQTFTKYAYVQNLVAVKANITDLDAVRADVQNLYVVKANVDSLTFYTLKGDIIATIAASAETGRIPSKFLVIDGAVQFGTGYDPTGKTTPNDVTTIINGTVTANYINALRGITLYALDGSNWLNVLSNGLEFSNTSFFVGSQGNNLLQVTLNDHLKLGNTAQWTVWDSGNHGSSSGLDADLLDGNHKDWIRDWGNLLNRPSTFTPSSHTHAGGDITSAVANATNADTVDGSHASAFAKTPASQLLGGGTPSGGTPGDIVEDLDSGKVWIRGASVWRQIA